jgi:hypothetical protein
MSAFSTTTGLGFGAPTSFFHYSGGYQNFISLSLAAEAIVPSLSIKMILVISPECCLVESKLVKTLKHA